MYIQKLRIQGFSGFDDSGWIEFSPKMNVIVGTNNSGKSALLRAASGSIPHNPHKSPERFLPGHLGTQSVEMDLTSSKAEFLRRLAAFGSPVQTWMGGPSVQDAENLKNQIEESDVITIHTNVAPESAMVNRLPTFVPSDDRNICIANVSIVSGELVITPQGGGRNDSTINIFTNQNDTAIFYFPSERYHRTTTGFGRHAKLAGDASNLSGFLQYLQGNDFEKFDEILLRLSQVIQSIDRITIDTANDGFQLLVWPQGSGSNRELAFSLDACGTGVSQVLAIFAAVVTKKESCIIVDEINSFLHPLAVKDLLSILSTDYPTNQYIISSHSSDVVSHPSVSNLIAVERNDFVSSVRSVGRDDLTTLKRQMQQLGISMADVLGADSILWVEGPTESLALPNLFRDHLMGIPKGLQVVAVSSTGDFEGTTKNKRAILKVYERFMEVAAPLATGQAFLLDREGLSDESVTKIEASTDGKLRFLSRRCIENFALSPKAIAQMLADDPEFLNDMDEALICETMIGIAQSPDIRGSTYFKGDLGGERWLREVDGAKLLKRLFSALSGNTFEFRKTIHTPILLSLVDSDSIADLLEVMRERVGFITAS